VCKSCYVVIIAKRKQIVSHPSLGSFQPFELARFEQNLKILFRIPASPHARHRRTFGPVCTKSSISFFNAFFILAARSRCSRICAAWRRSASSLKRCMLTGRVLRSFDVFARSF